MTQITGTYFNGNLQLDRPLTTSKPIKVTIVFEEEKVQNLTLSDFSFLETQQMLEQCTASFSEEVIDERRNAL